MKWKVCWQHTLVAFTTSSKLHAPCVEWWHVHCNLPANDLLFLLCPIFFKKDNDGRELHGYGTPAVSLRSGYCVVQVQVWYFSIHILTCTLGQVFPNISYPYHHLYAFDNTITMTTTILLLSCDNVIVIIPFVLAHPCPPSPLPSFSSSFLSSYDWQNNNFLITIFLHALILSLTLVLTCLTTQWQCCCHYPHPCPHPNSHTYNNVTTMTTTTLLPLHNNIVIVITLAYQLHRSLGYGHRYRHACSHPAVCPCHPLNVRWQFQDSQGCLNCLCDGSPNLYWQALAQVHIVVNHDWPYHAVNQCTDIG